MGSLSLFTSLLLIIAITLKCNLSCNDLDLERETIDGKHYTYCCVDCRKVYQGDMILAGSCCDKNDGDNNRRRLSPSLTNRKHYWPNGFIPYTIDSELVAIGDSYKFVTEAIKHWNDNTIIELYPRTDEVNYIHFKNNEGGCWSYVGMIGGVQAINLAAGCGLHAAIHEIGHAVGLYHTQSRQDRDLYVKIHFDKIDPGQIYNFQNQNDIADDCLKYDYNSIMHYPKDAFAISPGETIETINPPGSNIPYDAKLSELDISCVNSLYSPCRVSLYKDDLFQGTEYSPFGSSSASDLNISYYSLTKLLGLDFEDKQVTSMLVMVDSGWECTVGLTDSEFPDGSAWSLWWEEIVDDDDETMDLDIYIDNTHSDQHRTFSYTLSELQTYGFKDNTMSSMRLEGEPFCEVRMYGNLESDSIIISRPGLYTLKHLEMIDFKGNEVTYIEISIHPNKTCHLSIFAEDGSSDTTHIVENNTWSDLTIFEYDLSILESLGNGLKKGVPFSFNIF